MILRSSEATVSTPGGNFEGPSDDGPSDNSQAPNRSRYERVFNQLVDAIEHHLAKTNYHFSTSLTGEESQFTRFNSAKVRQSGQVCDGQLRLTLMSRDRTTTTNVPFTGHFAADWRVAHQALSVLQAELPDLPIDPYVVLPIAEPNAGLQKTDHSSRREVRESSLLPAQAIADTLIEPVKSLDFSGLYAGGTAYRAYGDSASKRHWFETPSFTLDYSLFAKEKIGGDNKAGYKAVKGTLAGRTWNPNAYQQKIAVSQEQLALLARPTKSIAKGAYRTYLAPAAVADLMDTIIYGGLGEADLRQGNSAFRKLEAQETQLSEQFSLEENFQRIDVPRFNGNGAVAPLRLPIIQQGRWASSLVNARSAKEYNKPSNAANAHESMRAPSVAPGDIPTRAVLSHLGTGLYLSNLHYLNWSDLNAGRITGMTRYACFWVEEGEIVAPIENLRFDDNFYRFLGEGLLGLTNAQTFVPAVDTYERRSLGGMWMPGMLIDQFRYTL